MKLKLLDIVRNSLAKTANTASAKRSSNDFVSVLDSVGKAVPPDESAGPRALKVASPVERSAVSFVTRYSLPHEVPQYKLKQDEKSGVQGARSARSAAMPSVPPKQASQGISIRSDAESEAGKSPGSQLSVHNGTLTEVEPQQTEKTHVLTSQSSTVRIGTSKARKTARPQTTVVDRDAHRDKPELTGQRPVVKGASDRKEFETPRIDGVQKTNFAARSKKSKGTRAAKSNVTNSPPKPDKVVSKSIDQDRVHHAPQQESWTANSALRNLNDSPRISVTDSAQARLIVERPTAAQRSVPIPSVPGQRVVTKQQTPRPVANESRVRDSDYKSNGVQRQQTPSGFIVATSSRSSLPDAKSGRAAGTEISNAQATYSNAKPVEPAAQARPVQDASKPVRETRNNSIVVQNPRSERTPEQPVAQRAQVVRKIWTDSPIQQSPVVAKQERTPSNGRNELFAERNVDVRLNEFVGIRTESKRTDQQTGRIIKAENSPRSVLPRTGATINRLVDLQTPKHPQNQPRPVVRNDNTQNVPAEDAGKPRANVDSLSQRDILASLREARIETKTAAVKMPSKQPVVSNGSGVERVVPLKARYEQDQGTNVREIVRGELSPVPARQGIRDKIPSNAVDNPEMPARKMDVAVENWATPASVNSKQAQHRSDVAQTSNRVERSIVSDKRDISQAAPSRTQRTTETTQPVKRTVGVETLPRRSSEVRALVGGMTGSPSVSVSSNSTSTTMVSARIVSPADDELARPRNQHTKLALTGIDVKPKISVQSASERVTNRTVDATTPETRSQSRSVSRVETPRPYAKTSEQPTIVLAAPKMSSISADPVVSAIGIPVSKSDAGHSVPDQNQVQNPVVERRANSPVQLRQSKTTIVDITPTAIPRNPEHLNREPKAHRSASAQSRDRLSEQVTPSKADITKPLDLLAPLFSRINQFEVQSDRIVTELQRVAIAHTSTHPEILKHDDPKPLQTDRTGTNATSMEGPVTKSQVSDEAKISSIMSQNESKPFDRAPQSDSHRHSIATGAPVQTVLQVPSPTMSSGMQAIIPLEGSKEVSVNPIHEPRPQSDESSGTRMEFSSTTKAAAEKQVDSQRDSSADKQTEDPSHKESRPDMRSGNAPQDLQQTPAPVTRPISSQHANNNESLKLALQQALDMSRKRMVDPDELHLTVPFGELGSMDINIVREADKFSIVIGADPQSIAVMEEQRAQLTQWLRTQGYPVEQLNITPRFSNPSRSDLAGFDQSGSDRNARDAGGSGRGLGNNSGGQELADANIPRPSYSGARVWTA